MYTQTHRHTDTGLPHACLQKSTPITFSSPKQNSLVLWSFWQKKLRFSVREMDFSFILSNAGVYSGRKYSLGHWESFAVQPQKAPPDLCVGCRGWFKAQHPGRTCRSLLEGDFFMVHLPAGQVLGYFQHEGLSMGCTVNSAANLSATAEERGQQGHSCHPHGTA